MTFAAYTDACKRATELRIRARTTGDPRLRDELHASADALLAEAARTPGAPGSTSTGVASGQGQLDSPSPGRSARGAD